jgi:hypothetical protein
VPLLPRFECAVVFALVPREGGGDLVEPAGYDVDGFGHEPWDAGTVEEAPQLSDCRQRVVKLRQF